MNKHHHALQQQTLIALTKFKLHAFCLLFFSLIIYQTNAQLSDPPHAVCKRDTPVIWFTSNGLAKVLASQLDNGSYDDNTSSSELKFYYHPITKIDEFVTDCSDIIAYNNDCTFVGYYKKLKIFVEDKDGQLDSCESVVKFVEENDFCQLEPFGKTANIKIANYSNPNPLIRVC